MITDPLSISLSTVMKKISGRNFKNSAFYGDFDLCWCYMHFSHELGIIWTIFPNAITISWQQFQNIGGGKCRTIISPDAKALKSTSQN